MAARSANAGPNVCVVRLKVPSEEIVGEGEAARRGSQREQRHLRSDLLADLIDQRCRLDHARIVQEDRRVGDDAAATGCRRQDDALQEQLSHLIDERLRRRRISDQDPKTCRDHGREALHHGELQTDDWIGIMSKCRNDGKSPERLAAIDDQPGAVGFL